MWRTIKARAVTSGHIITECFKGKIIPQFGTDDPCSKIAVQTVPVAHRARLSHGKKRLTTRVAGTSGRAVVNDISPRYKHH